jgi:hypothetical protein
VAKTCDTLINEPTLSNLSRCSWVSSDNVTESAIESIRRIDSLSAKIDDKGSILPVFGAFDHHAEIASMGIRLNRALASIIHRPCSSGAGALTLSSPIVIRYLAQT